MFICKKLTIVAVSVFTLTCLYGCGVFFEQKIHTVTDIEVVVEKEKFSFKGKGSSAGVMLMSSMGPAGIAVGIAIDEGISKEITQSALNEYAEINEFSQLMTFYIKDVINHTDQATAFSNESVHGLINGNNDSVLITVKESGFLLAKGQQDQVMAIMTLLVSVGEKQVEVMFPNSSLKPEQIPTASFTEIKQQGAIAHALWEQSFQLLLASRLDTAAVQ